MKSALISGIGVIVGFTCAYFSGWSFATQAQNHNSTVEYLSAANGFNIPVQGDSARPVSRQDAYIMFYAYHQSTNPIESKGLLKRTMVEDSVSIEEPISYFFLDIDRTIQGITSKASLEGKDLVGFAAIPAFDQTMASHTLIWLGVVEEVGEDSIPERKLFFPQNPNTKDYIFNHGATCPSDCTINSDRLWEINWSN